MKRYEAKVYRVQFKIWLWVKLLLDDYFRYSRSALVKIFSQAGFREVKVKPLGFGPITAGISQFASIIKLNLVIGVIYVVALWLDRFLNRVFKKRIGARAENFPLSYFFVCKK